MSNMLPFPAWRKALIDRWKGVHSVRWQSVQRRPSERCFRSFTPDKAGERILPSTRIPIYQQLYSASSRNAIITETIKARNFYSDAVEYPGSDTFVYGGRENQDRVVNHFVENHPIDSIQDLEGAVDDFEQLSHLHPRYHEALLKPLLQFARDFSEQHKDSAAFLGERLLLNCLARLPEGVRERHRSRDNLLLPDLDDYHKVLLLCGTRRSLDGAEQADRVGRLWMAQHRQEVQQQHQRHADPLVASLHLSSEPTCPVPNMETCKFLLRAWALSGTWDGALKAGAILTSMERLSGMEEDELLFNNEADENAVTPAVYPTIQMERPDAFCYNTLLTSYSRLKPMTLDIVRHAHSVLMRMAEVQPALYLSQAWFAYYSVMRCYERHIYYLEGQLEQETPETEIAPAVIHQLSQDLEGLIDEFGSMPVPDSFQYKFEKEARSPDCWVRGIVVRLNALHPNTIPRAHSIVRSMADSPEQWPEHSTLVALYRAWKEKIPRETDGEKEKILVQNRLDELTQIAVDGPPFERIKAFNENLDRWAESRLEYAPAIMDAMLDKVLRDLNDEQNPSIVDHLPRPNPRSFSMVLRAWAYQGEFHHTESLLLRMNTLQDRTGFQRYKADPRHFKFVLRSWLPHCASGTRYKSVLAESEFDPQPRLPAQQITWLLCDFLPIKYRPDHVVSRNIYEMYHIALEAWSLQEFAENEEPLDCAAQALSLLDRLQDVSRKPPPSPICNLVLQTCVKWFPKDCNDKKSEKAMGRAYSVAQDVFQRGTCHAETYVCIVQVLQKYASYQQQRQSDASFSVWNDLVAVIRRAQSEGRASLALLEQVLDIARHVAPIPQDHFPALSLWKDTARGEDHITHHWYDHEATELWEHLPSNWSSARDKPRNYED